MGIVNDTNISIFNLDSLNFYYGLPSTYTNFSSGSNSPYETFNIAYHYDLDFIILTDYNNNLKEELKYNKHKKSKWYILNELSKRFNKKRENFTSFIGFETKSSPLGDLAIINSNSYFTGIINNLNILLLWLIRNPNSLIILTTPLKETESIPFNPLLNKVVTSFNVCFGNKPQYFRREKYYYNLLDDGWTIGAVNSQATLSQGCDNLTGIISSKLNKEKLINSIQTRRTFSSESRSLKLFFTVNNSIMGDIIDKDYDFLDFNILCEDKYIEILKIQIISNSGRIIRTIDDINLNKIKYLYSHTRKSDETWYLIKVFQTDDRISISSPVFIELKK